MSNNLQTIAFTLGPILLPYLWNQYRSFQAQLSRGANPIPLSRPAQNALHIFFLTTLIFFALSQSYFSPTNIFVATNSRMQTPTNVLFDRLSKLKPGNLTAFEAALRSPLDSVEGRLLYLKYGPDALAECTFCAFDKPWSYLVYTLPNVLFPHFLNVFTIGLATSGVVSGTEGSRWRTPFISAAFAAAMLDIGFVNVWDMKVNAIAMKGADITSFYWNMRIARNIGLAVLNIVFAGLMWLSSTNRMFFVPPGAGDQVDVLLRRMMMVNGRLESVGFVHNAAARDEALRARSDEYWRQEQELMTQVMEDRRIVEKVNEAVSAGRVNPQKVKVESKKWVEEFFKKNRS